MLYKTGDLQPITLVEPSELNEEEVAKRMEQLKKQPLVTEEKTESK